MDIFLDGWVHAWTDASIGHLHHGSFHFYNAFPLRAVDNLVRANVRMELHLVPRREDRSSEPRQVGHLAVQDHHLPRGGRGGREGGKTARTTDVSYDTAEISYEDQINTCFLGGGIFCFFYPPAG